jgi:hypothetical protein
VVNTFALQSSVPEYESRPGDMLSWLRILVVFLSPPRKCRHSILKQVTAASFHILSNSSQSSFLHNLCSQRSALSYPVTDQSELRTKQTRVTRDSSILPLIHWLIVLSKLNCTVNNRTNSNLDSTKLGAYTPMKLTSRIRQWYVLHTRL